MVKTQIIFQVFDYIMHCTTDLIFHEMSYFSTYKIEELMNKIHVYYLILIRRIHLDQCFSTRALLPFRRHLVTSGIIFGCHN